MAETFNLDVMDRLLDKVQLVWWKNIMMTTSMMTRCNYVVWWLPVKWQLVWWQGAPGMMTTSNMVTTSMVTTSTMTISMKTISMGATRKMITDQSESESEPGWPDSSCGQCLLCSLWRKRRKQVFTFTQTPCDTWPTIIIFIEIANVSVG